MLFAIFALFMLAASDAPRALPQLPAAGAPWAEEGNRHARRRDKKLSKRR